MSIRKRGMMRGDLPDGTTHPRVLVDGDSEISVCRPLATLNEPAQAKYSVATVLRHEAEALRSALHDFRDAFLGETLERRVAVRLISTRLGCNLTRGHPALQGHSL